jgi:hypothetical protein
MDVEAPYCGNGVDLCVCVFTTDDQLADADLFKCEAFCHFRCPSLLTDYAELLCQ